MAKAKPVIPVKEAALSNKEKYYKGKMPPSFYENLDDNLVDEHKPDDPAEDDKPNPFALMQREARPAAILKKKGLSIDHDIELPDDDSPTIKIEVSAPKRKRAVGNY
jgi:hypothetical protein